jgi:CheY-like chemotaxis protein
VKTILVVDDEPQIAEIATDYLVRLLAGLGAGALALLASAGWLKLDIASIKE